MRIYVIIERYPNPYKPYIDTQVVEFLRLGHDVTIFAGGAYRNTIHAEVRRYRLEERARYYPETLKDLPKHLLPSLFRLSRAPVSRFCRMRQAIEKSWSPKFRLMAMARMLALPETAPDLCLVHNLSTVASFPFLTRYYPESRVVMYFHGGEVGGAPRVTGENRLFADMHAVFTNTEYSKGLAIERGCPPDLVKILPVGFSLSDYIVPPNKSYRPAGKLRLVSVGRMGQEKGFDIAIDALRQLVAGGYTNVHYKLVGSGQRFKALTAYVRENRLEDYVSLVGEMEKREVVQALADSDVLILPSLITETWAETQACVVQEAMLMGLSVITTVAGGVPESIAPEMKAFSVLPGDAAAIRDRIIQILGMSGEDLRRLGVAGRRFVTENYDIVNLTQRLLSQAGCSDIPG